jgi:hypothetical protein
MERAEALKVLRTHHAMGAAYERLVCCVEREEWPCEMVREAGAVVPPAPRRWRGVDLGAHDAGGPAAIRGAAWL